jgi:hypothetical protein
MRLTLEILKKLNDFDYVLGIMGDYTGSNPSMGPRYDIGDFQKRRQEVDDRKNNISRACMKNKIILPFAANFSIDPNVLPLYVLIFITGVFEV